MWEKNLLIPRTNVQQPIPLKKNAMPSFDVFFVRAIHQWQWIPPHIIGRTVPLLKPPHGPRAMGWGDCAVEHESVVRKKTSGWSPYEWRATTGFDVFFVLSPNKPFKLYFETAQRSCDCNVLNITYLHPHPTPTPTVNLRYHSHILIYTIFLSETTEISNLTNWPLGKNGILNK